MTKNIEDNIIAEFIQILEGFEKFIAPPLNINKNLLAFVRRLREILATKSNISSGILLDQIEKITVKQNKSLIPNNKKIDPEKLVGMQIQDVEALLYKTLLKSDLLSIAEIRFGAPPGNLRRYNIKRIREKIEGMIKNEKSHQSIAKVASSVSKK